MSWQRFLRRKQWDREQRLELESYLAIEADDNLARGMSAQEANAAACRKLGNRTRIREEIYSMNTIDWLEELGRDVRHACRLLRRNPMFAAVAVLTLAIGIGANTTVFAVLNSVLLKPLPYPNPDELVTVHQAAPGAPGLADLSDGLLLSASMYFTYADHNRVFSSMGVFETATATLTGIGEPEQVRLVNVTDGVLQALAVAPASGRWLNAGDQTPGGPKTVMISDGYWRRRFAGDRSVVGHVIRVDGKALQIVGVMPRGFKVVDADFDLIVPTAFNRQKLNLAGFGYQSVARLKPGITIPQADADLAPLVNTWMDSWSNGPISNPHYYEQWRIRPDIRTLQQAVVGNIGNLLGVVMATVGLVMLLACANVTNLLLVRTEGRQQELAVRSALGAGWARILRELFVESVVLGGMAGALGVALAFAALRVLKEIGPANLPRLSEISLDARAIAFTFVLCLVSSLFLAAFPALKYARPQIASALRGGGRNASMSRDQHIVRNGLVVLQVAIALILLVSAGLMMRTFGALRAVQPGFSDAKDLQTVRTSIPNAAAADAQRVMRLEENLAKKLAAVPGVTSVAFVNQMPMQEFGSDWDEIAAEGRAEAGKTLPMRLYKYVSPGFFTTAGTRLVAGHDYSWTDLYELRPVLMVSANLARELWGSPAAAVGKRLREYESTPWREVIGVVEDVRENGVDKDAPATVYWPALAVDLFGRNYPYAKRDVTFVLRTQRAGSQSLLREMQQTIWSVEPSLPVASVRTMREIFDKSLARTSFALVMLALAASMAMVLGLIGIYGVISYAVSQRTREIGIRIALGARPAEVEKMFLRSGIKLAGIGLFAGMIVALALTRFLRSLLFGISSLDPVTYGATAALLALCALVATYLPARRAANVDPVEALRAD